MPLNYVASALITPHGQPIPFPALKTPLISLWKNFVAAFRSFSIRAVNAPLCLLHLFPPLFLWVVHWLGNERPTLFAGYFSSSSLWPVHWLSGEHFTPFFGNFLLFLFFCPFAGPLKAIHPLGRSLFTQVVHRPLASLPKLVRQNWFDSSSSFFEPYPRVSATWSFLTSYKTSFRPFAHGPLPVYPKSSQIRRILPKSSSSTIT